MILILHIIDFCPPLRCGASGSICVCHAADPDSILGRTSFPGEFFSEFFLNSRENVRKL